MTPQLKLQSLHQAGKHGKVKEQGEAAVKLQSLHPGRKARKEAKDQDAAEVSLYIETKSTKDNHEKKMAATKIQTVHRGRKAKVSRKKRKDAAVQIQKVQRGNLLRKENTFLEEIESLTSNAATVSQILEIAQLSNAKANDWLVDQGYNDIDKLIEMDRDHIDQLLSFVCINSAFSNSRDLYRIISAFKGTGPKMKSNIEDVCKDRRTELGNLKYKNNTSGSAPFIVSCKTGALNDVQRFVELGIGDINMMGAADDSLNECTGLMLAAMNEHVDVVKFLLQLPSIDVSICSSRGWNALHVAAWKNAESTETVQLLADHSTCTTNVLNAKSIYGETPLDKAMGNTCELQNSIVEVLRAKGGRTYKESKKDMSAS